MVAIFFFSFFFGMCEHSVGGWIVCNGVLGTLFTPQEGCYHVKVVETLTMSIKV